MYIEIECLLNPSGHDRASPQSRLIAIIQWFSALGLDYFCYCCDQLGFFLTLPRRIL